MFDDEEYNEDEEMAPEEESFPVDSGENESPKRKSSLSELKQKSNKGSSKDGQNLQNKIAANKTKNASSNIAKAAGNGNKNGSQKGEGEENEEGQEENGDKKDPKVNNAEQAGATEAAKVAAATAMQAAGVPKPIADKVSEKVLDSEQGQKIINETIKKFKEQKKKIILRLLAPIIPYVLGIFAVILVAVMVMAQLMTIVEKVEGAFITVSTGIEKIINFTSGNGWNTEEELFFITLEDQYKESLKYSEKGIDIPLLAATIHYTRGVDVGIYEEDNSGSTDTSTPPDSDSEQLFGNFLEAEDLKNFYYVANDKLGSIYAAELGKRRLIGHMFDIKISLHRTVDDGEAWDGLGRFLGFLGKTIDENLFSLLLPGTWKKNIRTMIAYESDSTEDGYFDYYVRNVRYEIDEFLAIFDAAYNDGSVEVPSEEETGWWVYPSIDLTYNEDKYYEYLVNVYIPGTYFSGGELTTVQQEEVERIAREIFEQRDNYDYLVNSEDETTEVPSCRYTYGTSEESTATLSGQTVNENFINNLNIELLDASCNTIGSCTDDDITDVLSLKDYVIGVAYSEIGASKGDNEEWLKANMVAIQSYTLNRNSSTLREESGTYYIKMINNTTNQTYCSVSEGCMERSSNRKPSLTEENIAYLESVYDQIKTIFLYTSSGSFIGSYRSDYSLCVSAGISGSCMGQNDSEVDADSGLSYENILGKYYTQDIGLLDISSSSFRVAVYQCYSSGLVAGNHSNIMIRTAAPSPGDTYYNQPYVYNSNRGQCVWYVKGRASEIVSTSVTDATVRDTLLSVLRNATGNGNQWYNEDLQRVFGSSADYTKPKAGSIAVYDWTDARCRQYYADRGQTGCPQKYGHSLIIEEVNEAAQTVTYTDGYADGGSCPTNWDCVRFRYYQNVPISQLDDLGGGYIFIGYIYLLD